MAVGFVDAARASLKNNSRLAGKRFRRFNNHQFVEGVPSSDGRVGLPEEAKKSYVYTPHSKVAYIGFAAILFLICTFGYLLWGLF